MAQEQLDRIYEIYFLEMCNRIVAYRNSFEDLTNYLKGLQYLIKYNQPEIIALSRNIFEKRFRPSLQEILKALEEENVPNYLMYQMTGITRRKVETLLKDAKENVLYPRTNPTERVALREFMEQYTQLNKIDLMRLL